MLPINKFEDPNVADQVNALAYKANQAGTMLVAEVIEVIPEEDIVLAKICWGMAKTGDLQDRTIDIELLAGLECFFQIPMLSRQTQQLLSENKLIPGCHLVGRVNILAFLEAGTSIVLLENVTPQGLLLAKDGAFPEGFKTFTGEVTFEIVANSNFIVRLDQADDGSLKLSGLVGLLCGKQVLGESPKKGDTVRVIILDPGAYPMLAAASEEQIQSLHTSIKEQIESSFGLGSINSPELILFPLYLPATSAIIIHPQWVGQIQGEFFIETRSDVN